jgi:sugar phosphate isomerase/epimerase
MLSAAASAAPKMLHFAYNTNGMAHHRLDEALRLLAEIGYHGCALTLDTAHLDPFAAGVGTEVDRVSRLARSLGLELVVETGARYLLDPRFKHQPTLLSNDPDGRARRLDFYTRAIRIARDLGAGVVSLWSGVPQEGLAKELGWTRLKEGLGAVLDEADRAGVRVAFEPEPGMLVENMAGFTRLRKELPRIFLTLDLGHAHLTEAQPVAEVVRAFASQIINVHAEDMRRPVHEHLPFGAGEMDYRPILAALDEVGYRGLVAVELSRDSHRAPEMARAAHAFLQKASPKEVS